MFLIHCPKGRCDLSPRRSEASSSPPMSGLRPCSLGQSEQTSPTPPVAIRRGDSQIWAALVWLRWSCVPPPRLPARSSVESNETGHASLLGQMRISSVLSRGSRLVAQACSDGSQLGRNPRRAETPDATAGNRRSCAARHRKPLNTQALVSKPCGHSGVWQTASMLFPSGSRTNAP